VSAVAQASYRCRYCLPHAPTIGLTALGQVVQADKYFDLVGTKGRRKEPDAIAQARLVRGLTLTMTRALGVLT
jgi:hypothetical protein